MAPRNNESNASFGKKKNGFPVDCDDMDVRDIVPSLLHKKHKVVKLVKSQLQRIQEEGLFCSDQGRDAEIFYAEAGEQLLQSGQPNSKGKQTRGSNGKPAPSSRLAASSRSGDGGGEELDMNGRSDKQKVYCLYVLTIILIMLILIFIAVWVSAGPLSNSMAHTPIPPGSFVRTDGLCSLERKYLLRWSKPEYYE